MKGRDWMNDLVALWNTELQKILLKNRLRLTFKTEPSLLKRVMNLKISSGNEACATIEIGEEFHEINRDFAGRFFDLFMLDRFYVKDKEFIGTIGRVPFDHFFIQNKFIKDESQLGKLKAVSQLNIPVYLIYLQNEYLFIATTHGLTGRSERFLVAHKSEHFDLFKTIVEEEFQDSWFNFQFLSDVTGHPVEYFRYNSHVRDRSDSEANFLSDWLLNIIDETCGFDAFCERLVEIDGYAHWINTEDRKTVHKIGDYYIYPIC